MKLSKIVENLVHKFNKNQLANKYLDEKMAKESAIKRLEEATENYKVELSKKDKELHELKRTTDYWNTEDFIVKKILELRAKGLPPTLIRKKLELMNIDVENNMIMNILQSEFTPDHEKYYAKCVLEYTESIKINTDLQKNASLEHLQAMMDFAYLDLERLQNECSDPKEMKNIRTEILQYVSEINKLTANIDESVRFDAQEEMVTGAFEEYKSMAKDLRRTLTGVNVTEIGEANEFK